MAMRDKEQEVKYDMTPMIDVVFLLIIFFVLVIDLTQKDLEELKLPRARYAEPDENPPDGRPIMNILQDGAVVHQRRTLFQPGVEEDAVRLRDTLLRFAQRMPKESFGNLQVPADPLLVRADMWTDFGHVARLMEECGRKDVMIWRLELALAEPED